MASVWMLQLQCTCVVMLQDAAFVTASGVYDANIDVIREMSYFIFFSSPEVALLCMLTVE